MSESVRQTHHLTVEEYLNFEETTSIRHEYVGGSVFAMTGAMKRHNRIIANIFRKLGDAADVIYYPDVMVACEPDDDPLVEHKPCLVIEVASPATEATDRREKLLAHRKMPSVREYLFVARDRRWVEHHFRSADGEWKNEILEEGSIPLRCPPGASLTLDDVYRRTEFASQHRHPGDSLREGFPSRSFTARSSG